MIGATLSPMKNNPQEVGPSEENKSPVKKGLPLSPQAFKTLSQIRQGSTNAHTRSMGTASKVAIIEAQLNVKDEEIERLEKVISEKENEIRNLKESANEVSKNAATASSESQEELQTKIDILTVAVVDLRSEILKIYFREGVEKLGASDNYLKYTGIQNFPGRRQMVIMGTSIFAGLCASTQVEGIGKKILVVGGAAGLAASLIYLTDPDSKVIQTMKEVKKKCKKYNLKWQPSQNLPSEGKEFFNLVRENYSSSWYSVYTSTNNKQILQLLAEEVPETTLNVSTDTAAALPAATAAASTTASAPKTTSIPAQRPNLGTPPPVSNLPIRTRRELFPPALPTDNQPLPSVITQSAAVGAAK